MKPLTIAGLMLVPTLGGCAKFALDSAPADQHNMYVVGQSGNSPVIWRCPKHPGQAKCHRINVEVR